MRHARNILSTALLLAFFVAPVSAQEEEIGFDDVVEETATSGAFPSWVDDIHLSGRFDLNLEIFNPGKDNGLQQNRFRNYHKFLFMKVTPSDRLTLDAEILDLSYYEIKAEVGMDFTLSAGKIWVPFGSTPFHHYYGAVQGDPFTGLLLPNVWSEFGVNLTRNLYNGERVSVDADAYVIKGFDGPRGTVLNLSAGGSDNVFAYGGRAYVGIGSKIGIWGSVLYNQFDKMEEPAEGIVRKQGELLLWGADLLLDYGLIDVPFLRDIRFRGAFARAEIRDELLVDPGFNSDSWYYRYGDYAEVTYRGFNKFQTRVRYGTIVDFDDVLSNNDSHNWDLALMTRLGPNLSLLAEYQINQEEVNELDNDLFRAQLVFEF